MEALEAILTRRSVREYTAQVVSDETLQKLLEAAMQAPSAGNQQPWHFVIIRERKQLISLASVLRFGKMLEKAPVAVTVCANLDEEKYHGYWVQDCSAAAQNMLLAAHALGLGAVWLGVYPIEDRVANIQKILDLPERVIPLCLVSLGYPAGKNSQPEKRFDLARVYNGGWQDRA